MIRRGMIRTRRCGMTVALIGKKPVHEHGHGHHPLMGDLPPVVTHDIDAVPEEVEAVFEVPEVIETAQLSWWERFKLWIKKVWNWLIEKFNKLRQL